MLDKISPLTKKPFLFFLPFLFIYSVVAILFQKDICLGDQMRYVMYAENLLQGYYSPPAPDIDLGNSPGYPLVLVPFIALNLPSWTLLLLNAVLYYLSVIFVFLSVRKLATQKIAIIISVFWAIYPNAYEQLSSVLPEIFSVFLVSLIVWCTINAFEPSRTAFEHKVYTATSGVLMGFLILTKPIFGYVIITLLIGSAFFWLVFKNNFGFKKALLLLVVALFIASPYLLYTYQLTGKKFYWSSFGGDNLYWMSTPFPGEYGSWYYFETFRSDYVLSEKEVFSEEIQQKYYQNHKEYFSEIEHHKGVELDDALKRLAIQNIKSHPKKFLLNCISNLGRIMFNFPYSYQVQSPKTLVRLPFNGFILVFAFLSLIPTVINWRRLPFSLRFLLFFSLIYLGGSVLGSAETRMFTIIAPVFLIWIGYVISKVVQVNLEFE
jgi:hypothetical protein